MKPLSEDLPKLRAQALEKIALSFSETPDRQKATGSQTRFERSNYVTFETKSFIFNEKQNAWICKGQTDKGQTVTISQVNAFCSCPDNQRKFGNGPCKHICALAKSIIIYTNK